MGVEEDRLSKVLVAGLRTQPAQAETEQCITGKAIAIRACQLLFYKPIIDKIYTP